MHIYAFGSVCRGEVSPSSDVDILAVVEGSDPRFDANVYSVYSYKRLSELWREGNPFAWHLSIESKLIYSADNVDFIKTLGCPSPYKNCLNDCNKFHLVFKDARASIAQRSPSSVFDLSTVFLSIRNIATCFSLGTSFFPNFSRHSALRLGSDSIPLSASVYQIFERARVLCTRGYGLKLSEEEVGTAIQHLGEIEDWIIQLLKKVEVYERI